MRGFVVVVMAGIGVQCRSTQTHHHHKTLFCSMEFIFLKSHLAWFVPKSDLDILAASLCSRLALRPWKFASPDYKTLRTRPLRPGHGWRRVDDDNRNIDWWNYRTCKCGSPATTAFPADFRFPQSARRSDWYCDIRAGYGAATKARRSDIADVQGNATPPHLYKGHQHTLRSLGYVQVRQLASLARPLEAGSVTGQAVT